MTATFEEGAALFDAGAYFEAHEVWEILWREAREGPSRTMLQGLIQAAAAFHKLGSRGDVVSARRILTRACAKLEGIPPEYANFDISDFRIRLAACLGAMTADGIDRALVPRFAKGA